MSNEQLLIEKAPLKFNYPVPIGRLNAPCETTPWTIRQLLHHRRAGIKPLIGRTKHGGQLGRSRMRCDATTKSAGYAAVFGFNLRQLTRCLAGEARPKVDVVNNIAANDANIIEKINMQLA